MANPFCRPEAGNFSKKSVYQLAAKIAAQLDYTPNGDIHAAIKKAGGSIDYRNPDELEGGESGSMIIESVGKFQILLSNYTSMNRDRFTIAHELGHYVLHYFIKAQKSPIGRMICTRAGEGRVEWEANWFAAGFLMPEPDFRRIYEELQDPETVADCFGVSLSAVKVRARNLGLK